MWPEIASALTFVVMMAVALLGASEAEGQGVVFLILIALVGSLAASFIVQQLLTDAREVREALGRSAEYETRTALSQKGSRVNQDTR